MVGAGVPRLLVSKILKHVDTGVTAVYDRHSYDGEKRAALDFWGKRVEAIIANKRHAADVPPENVKGDPAETLHVRQSPKYGGSPGAGQILGLHASRR